MDCVTRFQSQKKINEGELIMKKFFAVIALMSLIISPCSASQEDRAYFPAVLMYHDLKVKPLNEFDTTPEDFASQLDWLKDNGYITLSLEEFITCTKKGSGFPEKSVLITFDDGYAGIYDYAFPELKKRGMKAAFFIVAFTVGSVKGTYPHITYSQLAEMAADGNMSIGAHTVSHSRLTELSPDALKIEVSKSKQILENFTGRKIRAVAYPEGYYNNEVIDAVKEAGYEIAFAVNDRGLCGHEARYSIPRIYTGLRLAENDNALFKNFVKRYKEMPTEGFKERWKPIDNAAN